MKQRPTYLSDGIRMIRFDIARLDPRFAVPARGWHTLMAFACYGVGVACALVLIRCACTSWGAP